jgi:Fe-S oxidoreductase
VVLLDDCLTSYCEPQVNRAAVSVLERAGYEVVLAGLECCGRALASKGFLTEAQQLARQNIARLLPWAEQGLPIVGCEPSCLLMLVDEYPDLVPGEAAQKVAARAALVDSFIAQQAVELPVRRTESKVLLHGHCHQKALVGLRDTQQVLKSAAAAIETVDSGCCGMAGSFGYEHYDTSMAIGERVLFKAVRKSAQDEIIAPGFSCRQQILHGTGRKALHPIEFLAQQLG